MATVLVVHDDGMLRYVLRVFLVRDGHRVLTAVDGEDGVLAFENNAPDLVILDRNLTGMSGWETFDRIRGLSKGSPIIVLSGYHEPEDADNYLRSGAAAFLSKDDGLPPVLAEVARLAGPRGKRNSPYPEAVKPAGRAAAGTASSRFAGLVLIADDDPDTRTVLRRFLSSLSYVTLEAENGAAALELARAHKPDIVLLDIIMPKRNGFEVLLELAPEMPGTGFLMTTGNEDEELARECLKNGAFDYMSKPLNLAALSILLRSRILVQKSGISEAFA